MNIYATGMNPADANALKRSPRVAIFQAFVQMMDHLKANGEDVTWQRTRVGEELPPKTDVVVVSSMLPRSLNCPYALGVMWAMHQAMDKEIPLVIYLTDWAFFRATSEFRSIAKAGVPYFSKKIGGSLQYNEDPSMIAKYGDDLVEVCRQYDSPTSVLWGQAQVLVPKYTNWGDMKIIQRYLPGANPVLPMDPSPLFLKYLGFDTMTQRSFPLADREKAWILPSLLKDNTWLDKQNLQWPVHRFGPQGFPVVEDERAVQREYRERVGAICPPYPTVGSGWWRSRWIHSALAGNVLLCDSNDAIRVGLEYHISGRDYERMDNWQLQNLADQQKSRMNELIQRSMDVLNQQIYEAFRKAGV